MIDNATIEMNPDEIRHNPSEIGISKLYRRKYLVSIMLGGAILVGIFLTNQQIVLYQEKDVEESKQVAIDSFHRLADRKERRLETIASGLVGFYKQSSTVELVQYQAFVTELTRVTPDLDFILVTQNGKIIQSYPDISLVGKTAGETIGLSTLRHLEDGTQLLLQFPIDQFPGDDRMIVLAVRPAFFADPREIMGDEYKAIIAVSLPESYGGRTSVFQSSSFGANEVRRNANFETFSESEKDSSISVTITTALQAYGTDANMFLLYEVWDSSFEIHSIPFQYLSAITGGTVAVAVSILLLRSQSLSERLQQNVEKLNEADKFKTDFISMASHELKNSVQPIIAYAELAKKDLIDKNEAFDVIRHQARSLRDLTNDILDVSKIEGRTLECRMEQVNLNDLLKNIVEPARMSVKDNAKLRLELNTDGRIISIDADGARLTQVINNLLNNALKFTTEGAIVVSSRLVQVSDNTSKMKEPDKVKVKVTDSGPGIPPEMLPKLFTKFSTKDVVGRNKTGTGLGLFIAKAIVEAHGGQIRGENNPNGIGANFEIILPLKDLVNHGKLEGQDALPA